MSLHMPPHIFRLTTFRVPLKVEIGPDGKPRLVETEDLEPVDSKDSIPSSPIWSSQGSRRSPASPVDVDVLKRLLQGKTEDVEPVDPKDSVPGLPTWSSRGSRRSPKPWHVKTEDVEPVDSMGSIPGSPCWSSQGSPASPVDVDVLNGHFQGISTCWIAADHALQHARNNILLVSEIFDKWQIQKSKFIVLAGFDESLIKSGVGYLEQIHVFVIAEVHPSSPLLTELREYHGLPAGFLYCRLV